MKLKEDIDIPIVGTAQSHTFNWDKDQEKDKIESVIYLQARSYTKKEQKKKNVGKKFVRDLVKKG